MLGEEIELQNEVIRAITVERSLYLPHGLGKSQNEVSRAIIVGAQSVFDAWTEKIEADGCRVTRVSLQIR